MSKYIQIVITAVVAVAAFYLTDLLLRASGFFDGQLWLPRTLSIVFALLIGWSLWIKFDSDDHGVLTRVFQGAFFVGGIAFLIGFVGPMIFTPDANQGPMFGIFVTGPLGTIFGAIGGFIYWYFQDRDVTE